MASLREIALGSEAKTTQTPRFSPEQIAQQNQLAQMGMKGIEGTNFNFGPVEQRLRRLHSEQALPTIANRFLGGQAANSGAYQNALRQGGLDLEERIGMAENAFNQQRFQNSLQLLQQGQQPQYENIFQPESWGLVGSAGNALQRLLAAYFTGGGSEAGAGINSLASVIRSIMGNSEQPVEQAQGGIVAPRYPNFAGGQAPLSGIPMLNLISDLAQQINKSGQSYQEPSQRPGEVNALQNLVQNLGTIDVNKLRQQKLLKQLQPLLMAAGAGV
jgi:hypothetical protein